MAKGRPILLKPGFLANDVVPDYERLRNENIKRNNDRCKKHGVKTIATSVVSPVQAERANESGKRNRGELDDGDYRPSEDENDNDYDHELDDSFEEEVSERATRSTPQPDMDTDTQDMDTQALQSAQPLSDPLAENDVALKVGKGRGPTRGKMAQRLIDKDGRLKVLIPPQFCAPIGEHAAKMASKIGYEVRTNVIDLGVRRWKAVDDTVKAPILQRLTDKFDLQGDPMDVDKVVAMQCGRRMSDFTFRLHKKYNKLLETKGPEYARSNPPRNVKLEQWTSLIDKKWNDKRWQAQSLVNTSNRASESVGS